MQARTYELLWALLLILFFAAVYVLFVAVFGSIPAAQSLFGHSLGLLGSLLVLMTETLYSLRKRSQRARWGRMSSWLQFHIITGLVGPFLILLHTSWVFNGLAGMMTLLMLVVVASGFFGRYIYTAIPRTADGVELAEEELEARIRAIEEEVGRWLQDNPTVSGMLEAGTAARSQPAAGPAALVLEGRSFSLRDRSKWREIEQKLGSQLSGASRRIRAILQERDRLERQKRSLAVSRRVLSIWHSLHVPVGLALFAAAAVHVAAALYYATLLH